MGRYSDLLCNGKYEMTNSSFADVQVQFDPQNYTVTEGDVVNITLVTNIANMFEFTVTLQYMNGSATGESSTAYICISAVYESLKLEI